MLGIDVLEGTGFAILRGKRTGLLTNAAGVNRFGVRSIDVLRRAAGVKLSVLYAVEHGLNATLPAEKPFADGVDPASGLKVVSLYQGHVLKPTPAQLAGIDVMVIDLQDVGVRSYTFTGAMKVVMGACFEQGKEVVVLDRPNPLGGLKVDGPSLDPDLISDVGRFRVPYVHGLTIGELALMIRYALPPGGLPVSPAVRAKGKLTVVAMRGWRRSMRWPDTGLTWTPPSGGMRDFEAVEGYAMTGLGCIVGGFKHGIGKQYPFRAVNHPAINKVSDATIEKELRSLQLPGLRFSRVSLPAPDPARRVTGVYVDITDFEAWQPTALSFHLMKLACKLEPRNPFKSATAAERQTFNVHVGSAAFFDAIARDGASVDVPMWLARWRAEAKVYQEQSRKFWLYQ
jgi:uncharacterized protein YbbC (DUF1343 family)